LADGRALLITDQFRILTGIVFAPDMRASFQRAIIGIEVITGSDSTSINALHNHTFSIANTVAKFLGSIYKNFSGGGMERGVGTWGAYPAGTPPTSVISAVGDVEFRPKYCVVNIFLRIN
jgi:hypothetical protein